MISLELASITLRFSQTLALCITHGGLLAACNCLQGLGSQIEGHLAIYHNPHNSLTFRVSHQIIYFTYRAPKALGVLPAHDLLIWLALRLGLAAPPCALRSVQ